MSLSPAVGTLATTVVLHTNQLQKQDVLHYEDKKLWGSKRLLVIILIFISNVYWYMLRCDLSIAMVEMTSEKNITIEGRIIIQEPEFAWDSQTKGWILSLYSYGYCLAALGGYLSIKYGGVTVNGFGILMSGVLIVLSPLALRTNIYLFGTVLIAEGLFESVVYASIGDVWSRWIPKSELPTTVSFCYTGYSVGAVVTYPIGGYIAQYWGWPTIFYISGIFALVLCVMFFKWVRNDPSKDENISEGELRYLKQQTSVETRDRKTITYPWKMIFTSKPVWSLCVNKIAYSWAQMVLVFCFPLYIKDVTNKSTAEVGVLSSIPNVIILIVVPISGLLVEYLQNALGFDSSKLQRWILAVGFLIAGILFIIVSFSSFTISMICFILITTLLTINIALLQLVIVGLSPNHAALIAGISVFWYTLSSIAAPLVIGYIVVDHTRREWGICFFFSGFLMIFTALITALFGSSDDQTWTPVNKSDDFDTNASDKEHR